MKWQVAIWQDIEKFLSVYRKEVPFIREDIVMYKEIHKTVAFLKRHQVDY